MQALSVLTKASVWYEMRVLWAIINHVKSYAMALAFILQTDMNQIFKWGTVHSCRSRGWKNIRGQSWRSIRNCRLSQIRNWCIQGPADLANSFLTSNFDLWYFCSLLTYKDVQYLIWKIWLISAWRLEAKVTACIFNMIHLCSKHPYFISYRGLC